MKKIIPAIMTLLFFMAHSSAQDSTKVLPHNQGKAVSDSTIKVLKLSTKDIASNDSRDVKIPEAMMVHERFYLLSVGSKENAAKNIRQIAEKHFGYMLEMNEQRLRVKVPNQTFLAFCDSLEKQGIVLNQSGSSYDNSKNWGELVNQIEVKRNLLQDYFVILQASNTSTTLQSVEREIMSLTNEIESLSGQLRKLEHESTFATVQVGFRYQDREGPVRDGHSVFPWINNLDVRNLLEDFQNVD